MFKIALNPADWIKLFTDIIFSTRVRISGPSMESSMFEGDLFLATKSRHRMNQLKQNDIVFFHHPDTNLDYVKRIVAVPKDVVKISVNNLTINNLDVSRKILYSKGKLVESGEWILKEKEFFVLGDNYNNSTDSRVFGPIKYEWILGVVWHKYYSGK